MICDRAACSDLQSEAAASATYLRLLWCSVTHSHSAAAGVHALLGTQLHSSEHWEEKILTEARVLLPRWIITCPNLREDRLGACSAEH